MVKQPRAIGYAGDRECRWCEKMHVLAAPGLKGMQPFLPREASKVKPLRAAIQRIEDKELVQIDAQIAALEAQRAQALQKQAAWRAQLDDIAHAFLFGLGG